jgi:hypothetical protein
MRIPINIVRVAPGGGGIPIAGLTLALAGLLALFPLTAAPAAAVAQPGCTTVFSGEDGWAIEVCLNDPAVTDTMQVVLDGVARGAAARVGVYHRSQAGAGAPQVAVFYASGFVRLKQNADPEAGLPFGSSFVLGPAYWSGPLYYHNPRLSQLEIDTTWLPDGPLRLRAVGRNQAFDVAYTLALPPPRDRQTRLHVLQTYTATTAVLVDPGRLTERQGFKLVQASSMFINQGGTCQGGRMDCHDSTAARMVGGDLLRHQAAFTQITPSAFIFSPPAPLGSTWLDVLHVDDEGWQGNTPSVRIALDALPAGSTLTPQGWISATNNPDDDNVGAWLHDDSPASASWSAGQRGQASYWLMAQDAPPDPWADLGLRPGLNVLDFEGGYNCFPVLPADRPVVTGTVGAVAGYADTALQLNYGLGSADGNWAQVRCNFDPPRDLSAYDHLRLEWRGDPAASASLEIGVINPAGAGQERIFARGYHHPAHRGWWGQLIIPFSFLHPWTPGATFDPGTVSAIFISVVKDPVDDAGGAGGLALDNLGAFNVISRTVPLAREAPPPNTRARSAAVAWLAAQQGPSGLLKSWAEEPICNAHTYDQALALIAFAREGLWDQADRLVEALAAAQSPNGTWVKSRNCDMPAAIIDGTDWEGDIAWAIYALSRYRALGGTRPEAQTALLKGAAWLKTRLSASDGCLVIDHTEGTLDAWWAFQAAGLDYADEADQVKDCLLTYYWDEAMGRFKGGRSWQQPYLDNQTWGAAFLRAVGETVKAQRALSYARAVLLTPAQGGQLFGFDGQGGPWSVWNEGTGQYVALCGAGSGDLLAELLVQQREDGAVPGSPDDFLGGGVWTTRWHGVAPTAWLYNALSGEPFGAATHCFSIYLPFLLRR